MKSPFHFRVFISYAHEQTPLGSALNEKLRARGARVFFDKDSLPPGQTYDDRIRDAIRESDVFVFLISAESVKPGKYTLTELAFARKRWPNPAGHVLPVLVPTVDKDVLKHLTIDPYLTESVTIFSTKGNFTTETADKIFTLRPRYRLLMASIAALSLIATAALGLSGSGVPAQPDGVASSFHDQKPVIPLPSAAPSSRRLFARVETGVLISVDDGPRQACSGDCSWDVTPKAHRVRVDTDACFTGCDAEPGTAADYLSCAIGPGPDNRWVSIARRKTESKPPSCNFHSRPGAAMGRENCECKCQGKAEKSASGLIGTDCALLRDECCASGRCSPSSSPLPCSPTQP